MNLVFRHVRLRLLGPLPLLVPALAVRVLHHVLDETFFQWRAVRHELLKLVERSLVDGVVLRKEASILVRNKEVKGDIAHVRRVDEGSCFLVVGLLGGLDHKVPHGVIGVGFGLESTFDGEEVGPRLDGFFRVSGESLQETVVLERGQLVGGRECVVSSNFPVTRRLVR